MATDSISGISSSYVSSGNNSTDFNNENYVYNKKTDDRMAMTGSIFSGLFGNNPQPSASAILG